jgi:hypothetical protein
MTSFPAIDFPFTARDSQVINPPDGTESFFMSFICVTVMTISVGVLECVTKSEVELDSRPLLALRFLLVDINVMRSLKWQGIFFLSREITGEEDVKIFKEKDFFFWILGSE